MNPHSQWPDSQGNLEDAGEPRGQGTRLVVLFQGIGIKGRRSALVTDVFGIRNLGCAHTTVLASSAFDTLTNT